MRKKICMLGASAVGKTSLVERFVRGIFSDKYLTTIGVKITKKTVSTDGNDLDLLIWDLNGEDRFQKLSMNYMRGASGYLLVIDGTRKQTLDAALVLHHRAKADIGDVPFIVLINKADLANDFEVSGKEIDDLRDRGWSVIETSAKTGAQVEYAFTDLAERIVARGSSA